MSFVVVGVLYAVCGCGGSVSRLWLWGFCMPFVVTGFF